MPAAPCVTILLAAPGPLAGIRDALQDWSALGLITPFLWIERAELKSAGQTPGLRIESGRAMPTTLERELRQSWAVCRIGVLVPGFSGTAPVSAELEDHVARRVAQASGSAPVTPVRFVVTRPRSGSWVGDPARREWHNVLISPEDRAGPTRGYQTLDPSRDAIDIGPHAAAVVAGVLALWDGIESSPLDNRPHATGRSIRLVRSFYRRLDARSLEALIRDQVTTTADGLPRPSSAGNGSRYVDDVPEATRRMSDAFWREHDRVLTSGALTPDLPGPGRIPAWEAIQMYFSFLLTTILRTPESWYNSAVTDVSRRMSKQLQKSIFGPGDSEYAIVVGGIRGDTGTPAGWQDLARAAERLTQLVVANGENLPALPGRTPQPAAWQDLVGVALTLADAGDRQLKFPPLQAGIERLVIRDPSGIAPGAAATFTELPDGIAAPDVGLRPTDALEIAVVRRRLDRAAADRFDPQIEHAKKALDHWQRRHEGGFTVRVGRRLAEAVTANANDVATLLQRLRAASELPPLDSDLLRHQRRLAIFMRVLFAIMIVAVIVLSYLGASDRIEDSTAALSSIGAVLIWLTGTAIAFAARQRNVFAELHRRRQGVAQAEIDLRNLLIRLEDLRRTAQAYGEFLEWSRIIAVVITDPFPAPATVGSPSLVIGEGMPSSTKVGVARPSEPAIEEAVGELRGSQYEFGWLTPVWQRVLTEAATRLGPRARRLRGDDEVLIYAEPIGPDDLLSPWAAELERGGVGTGAGDELWSLALDALRADDASRSLITEVLVADGGAETLADFTSEIGRSGVGSQPFDADTLVERARTAGKAAVDQSWSSFELRRGLGWGVVTVELSAAMPEWDLVGPDPSIEDPDREDETDDDDDDDDEPAMDHGREPDDPDDDIEAV